MPNLHDMLPAGASERILAASKGCSTGQLTLVMAIASELGAVIAKMDERITALEQHATIPEKP